MGQDAPIRVMVVDDHPMWRDAVARDLTEAGYDGRTPVTLVAAGSADPGAIDDVQRQAAMLAAHLDVEVSAAFVSAGEPLLRDLAPPVVSSYLLAPGVFHQAAIASGAEIVSAPLDNHPALADVVLDMKVLAELAPSDIPARLAALPEAYARWIREQRDRIGDPAEGLEDYRDVAGAAMDACERALARIRAGLDLLTRDPRAAEAFRFMNRAMWLQRTRSVFDPDFG